ncbi:MAG TPA: TonB-dependent receptor [Stellaceae bacterium]|nr:TonB-dependent receptor [Stellaceae bacterium]
MAGRRIWLAGGVGLALACSAARAQTAPPADEATTTLPTVEVIGTTPLPGTGIDRDKVPANVQSVTHSDLTREGTPSLTNALKDQTGSVNTNDNLVDQFQPDILYRGFEASPVLGTPQGIAVYQNGVRVNEAFGDAVNWDLIPDFAIDRLDIVSSNPVYGLNALGGAAVVTMKNGFTYQGFESELAGGSFNQFSSTFQYGKQVEGIGAYIGGRYYDSDGWRQFSPDNVKQIYADVGGRNDRFSLDINFTGANNRLFGQGTTPIQTLAVDRSLDFTTPQNNFDELYFVTLNGSYQATDDLSFQANAYRREFHQTVSNGDTSDFTACDPANGFLCQSDAATPLTQANGSGIPDVTNGGASILGQNDSETIHAVGIGGTLQTTYTGDVFGHENNFVFGGSLDHSDVDFQSTTEIGLINGALQVIPSGFFVSTAENTGFLATPVSLGASNTYYGVFLTDTFTVTPKFAVTASGRYNLAQIDLVDRLGPNLTGQSRYSRFNPAIGGTYKFLPNLTGYFGYSEGNRAPTPSEIECSNPAQPCVLPSSLSSDPPTLKQVVSHTYEGGLRGSFGLKDLLPGRFKWNAGLFRTDLDDDIYAVATSISTGFFQNIGSTRRQGIETGLGYVDESWSVYGSYSLVDATFQSPLTLPSPSNPLADASGNISVVPGDHLPGIPMHQLKVGADYHVTDHWTVGAVFTYFSDQYYRGDESNQNPKLPGYEVVNLHSSYTVTKNLEIFANLQNAFDTHYATVGAFGDPTGVGAPGVPTNGTGVDNRFVGPAPPISVFGGIRIRF